jgi:hypothetical protein
MEGGYGAPLLKHTKHPNTHKHQLNQGAIMLVKDILKLQLTDELVAQSGWVHQRFRSIETCRKTDVIKVQLVSHTKYQETFHGWETPAMIASKPEMLQPAPQGAKTFRFLVKWFNQQGDEMHALASPKEIWGLWSDAETMWSTADDREKLRQAEQARRYDHEQAVMPAIRQAREEREARLRTNHQQMFGTVEKFSIYSHLDSSWVDANNRLADASDTSAVFVTKTKGDVTISMDLYEQLIEELLTYRIDYA